MKLLSYFKDWMASAKQKEEFIKMWVEKNSDLFKSDSRECWKTWAKEVDWDAILVQDRIVQLEQKVESLLKAQSTPAA